MPWRSDRLAAEAQAYGATVEELRTRVVDYSDLAQRPARLAPIPNYTLADLRGVIGNRVYYTGEYSVGGYLNLKGLVTPEQLESALLDDGRGEAFAEFLAAPGLVLTAESVAQPTAAMLRRCARDGDCGPAIVSAQGYEPGHYVYLVHAETPVEGLLNEAFYPGWKARACDASGCRELDTVHHDLGLVQVELPAGDYRLEVGYEAPGRAAGLALFYVGLGAALAALLAGGFAARRTRRELGYGA
jgi:hypothetical protein